MKRKFTTVLLTIVLVVGLCILLYPSASDYYNSFHQSRAIAHYAEEVANIDAETYERLWREATAYNQRLMDRSNPFFLTDEELEEYMGVLNYSGSGVMGYISIPKITCELPIYHTTEESVLQIAIGHLEGSSLPVGGEGTHCVLSGHRGLPSAQLFSHLDRLEVGDTFVMRVLDETLTYEVDQIHTVLPTELQDLAIQEGRDYCTLVTCAPYGINTHRLLVRGHRTANAEEALNIRVTADALKVDPLLVASAAAPPLLLMVMLWVFTGDDSGSKKRAKNAGAKPNSPNSETERRDRQ